MLKVGTYTAGRTTPSVVGINVMYINNTSATSISNFTGGVSGQQLTLIFQNGNTTIVHNTSVIRLLGGASVTMKTNDTLTLIFSGGIWLQTNRALTP